MVYRNLHSSTDDLLNTEICIKLRGKLLVKFFAHFNLLSQVNYKKLVKILIQTPPARHKSSPTNMRYCLSLLHKTTLNWFAPWFLICYIYDCQCNGIIRTVKRPQWSEPSTKIMVRSAIEESWKIGVVGIVALKRGRSRRKLGRKTLNEQFDWVFTWPFKTIFSSVFDLVATTPAECCTGTGIEGGCGEWKEFSPGFGSPFDMTGRSPNLLGSRGRNGVCLDLDCLCVRHPRR